MLELDGGGERGRVRLAVAVAGGGGVWSHSHSLTAHHSRRDSCTVDMDSCWDKKTPSLVSATGIWQITPTYRSIWGIDYVSRRIVSSSTCAARIWYNTQDHFV